MTAFAELGLSEAALAAVERMGYDSPTPVQEQSIPYILEGRDVIAAASTGTGKTAAFLLPTLSTLERMKGRGRAPRVCVVSPTRELAQQISRTCMQISRKTGHFVTTVYGGTPYGPQIRELRGGTDVLIATPGRLNDLMDRGVVDLSETKVLVLDEADRMLDMGFLPQVRTIVSKCREERQTLLFSATLDEERVGAITDLVHEPARVEIAPVTSTADTVDQYVVPVSMDEKNALLAEVLKKEGPERVIVFVRTKRRADTCVRRLARSGFKCEAIHGDRSQGQRQRALAAFRDGRVQVLVATDVLARGIDVSDVRYVINFDVPGEPTDYIHRIGRTGRAGEEGWSLTFVTKADIAEFFDIEALMGKTANMYDATGLTLGTDLPRISPDRVPADHAATKNERKRRKQKEKRRENAAKRAAAKRSDSSRPARPKRTGKARVRADEATGAVKAETAPKAETSEVGGNRAERRAAKFAGREREFDRRDRRRESDRSRRGSRKPAFERADKSEGKAQRGEEARFDREKKASRGGAAKRGRSGAALSARGRHGSDVDARTRNGEEVRFNGRAKHDTWRNYDEGEYGRGGRGGRGGYGAGARSGRSGGRDNRGSYGGGKRGGRRVGDRGGKRS